MTKRSNNGWKKGAISISVYSEEGYRKIEMIAEISPDGIFAVHNIWGTESATHLCYKHAKVLTHVKSGFSIYKAKQSKEEFRELATVLSSLGIDAWDFKSPASKKFKDIRLEAKMLAKERCGVNLV